MFDQGENDHDDPSDFECVECHEDLGEEGGCENDDCELFRLEATEYLSEEFLQRWERQQMGITS